MSAEENANKPAYKLWGLNLLILACYVGILNMVFQGTREGQLGLFLTGMIVVTLHASFHAFYAVYFLLKKESKKGAQRLVCAILLLLLGFAMCWGSAGGFVHA